MAKSFLTNWPLPLVAVITVTIGWIAGCGPTPPKVPLISGRYPDFELPPVDFHLGVDGHWELSSSVTELSIPVGKQKFAWHWPVTVDEADLSKLPPFFLVNIVDSDGFTYFSLSMIKSVSDDGTVEYANDGSAGVAEMTPSEIRLTAKIVLLDNDDPGFSVKVRLVEASHLIGKGQ